MTYSNTATQKTGTWWKILGGLIAVILVLLLLAEFGLRWYIKDNISNSLKEEAISSGVQLREDPDVTLGKAPLLLGVAQGKIPELNMTIPSTLQVSYENNDQSRPVVKGNPEVTMNAKDITGTSKDEMVMGSLDVTTLMPTDAMLAQAQASMNESKANGEGLEGIMAELLKVTDINTDEEAQTLIFQLGGGIADLVLKPEVVNGELSMQAEDVRVLGFSLPSGITKSLEKQLADQAAEAGRAMGEDMKMKDVHVERDGLHVTMHGTNVNLKEMTKSVEGSGELQGGTEAPPTQQPGPVGSSE